MQTTDKFLRIRGEFPVTNATFVSPGGATRKIIYLDHGASTHPPSSILDIYRDVLEHYYANIHRGNHYLSQKASQLFDEVTETVLNFIGADHDKNEVIFTMNTTTAIDIASHIMRDEEGIVLVSEMEHHSNDLPHRRRGEVVKILVDNDGRLDYNDLEEKLKRNKVKLVAITGASNVTGYLPDIHAIARLAHQHGAKILVDAAQLLAHKKVDVKSSEADDHIDFFAAAGHKAYAPFGAAFLVAPRQSCDATTPYIPGGGTVQFVTNAKVIWAEGQDRHSGGTPNIPGVIALGKALNWLDEIGMDWVREHELELLRSTDQRLRSIEGVKMLGNITPDERLGVCSFNIDGYHDEQASLVLNNDFGIATRNGCFCAHPYMIRLLDINDPERIFDELVANSEALKPGAVRATIGIFNNQADMDLLVEAVTELAAHPEWAERASFTSDAQCNDYA
ncbi:MAG: aminotransferase class V-fold PLP-dependent enzyme [Ignavibacteriae bacterium]|nr:aminotransferase class V-fold PLP-dependent enzyme [Ignavibacteriota bacterium]MCB9216089.1 aminotransferase class V-fold PLP-dependent enzyme [Ignavibacteria bacterium]